MSLKIVHVVEPFASGVAVFVKSLAEAMPEEFHLVIHGERKQVMPAEEVKCFFPKKNVRFLRWKSAHRSIHPVNDFLALNQLYKIFKRLKKKNLVDVVHLHSSKSGLLGRIACKLAGIENVIYTPNGAPFLSGSNNILNFLYKQVEKLGSGIGGKVVCCSASELAEYEKIGVDAIYINNGVSVKDLSLQPLPKPENQKFKVITTGRIEDQKNPVLFNSIATFFEDFDQIEFIWAGDGKARSVLTSKNIEVTGWLDPQGVLAKVAQADVFISTSVFEGLSFSVLEAMALKKPMLLSDCVGNNDVIYNTLNGDTFHNETEAIVKILNYFNNREMLEVMGQYSQEVCKTDFNIHLNFQSYKAIYQDTFGTISSVSLASAS